MTFCVWCAGAKWVGGGGASAFSAAQAQPPAETLRRYLLAGVAWRCLALLSLLGVEVAAPPPFIHNSIAVQNFS
ncbi:unnamed protein product, partial [Iphiclides podalirius]